MPYRIPLITLAAVMVTLAGMAAASPLGALNALAKADSAQITEGMAYGPGPRQKLDVYRPRGAAPASGFPVLVFFYGGSWNRGERADYAFVGRALASRGLLAVVADYRLYPEVRYPDFLTDCAQALAYTLDQATALGGNPKQVFVMGHSAGGYNAAMLAFDARWLGATGHAPGQLAGFIGLAGAYDFLPMTNPDTRPVFFHPHYPAGSQPIDYVSRASPPSFIGAASSDSLIDPQRNSVGLATRLQAAQVPVTLKLYDGLNHMTLAGALAWPLRWMAPVLDDVAGFVAATVREAPPLQRSGN